MIRPARIVLRDGVPWAEDFDDRYHHADGIGEVHRVMHAPARVAERLARGTLTLVGELGFGTGLNFAVTAEVARAARARLHFVSFEAHPIAPALFETLAARRAPELPIYRELAQQQPPLLGGWHRRAFDDGRIVLSVWYGDAAAGLADIGARQRRPVGAWLLDGFAPDRNPALWNGRLFEALVRLSAPGTTVTTFTAAGAVRRALTAAGFEMRRVDQRPHKRHSLAGVWSGPDPSAAPHRAAPGAGRVQVIGAGIAGASVARHLAGAGVEVTVWDVAGPAGSAIPAAAQHARLLPAPGPAAALRAHAWHYAAPFTRGRPGCITTGALQTGAEERLAQLATSDSGTGVELLDEWRAADLAGFATGPALHFPTAAVCDLPALCAHLLDHPLIRQRDGLPTPDPDVPLVLANGTGCRAHPAAAYLELADVAGQLDLVAGGPMPVLPVIGNGLLVPCGDRLAVGATYEYRPWSPERATAENLARLPPARSGTSWRWLGRVRGRRSVSSDRTPVAGRLPGTSGVWVTAGHGSAGAVSAPFAAAVVASQIVGDFEPLARDALGLLDPARFLERQARRGVRHGLPRELT